MNQNIHIHGSQHTFQIGDHNQQTVNIDIDRLNAAIDGSTATMEEKAAAKSLLSSLANNKLLLAALGWWFGMPTA